MAVFDDCKKVISLTKSLAAFFRISLSDGRSIITIGEELEHVSQYLYIQKQRYDDKLNYEISADEEILLCSVPKLILQPLAENSIYHGIRPLNRSGHIKITAIRDGASAIITVSDDGVGFNPTSIINKGVGLRNVQERIAIYYKEIGKVQVHSEPGKGSIVTITIPLNDAPGPD